MEISFWKYFHPQVISWLLLNQIIGAKEGWSAFHWHCGSQSVECGAPALRPGPFIAGRMGRSDRVEKIIKTSIVNLNIEQWIFCRCPKFHFPHLHQTQIYTNPRFTQDPNLHKKNKFGSGVNVENVNLGQRQYCNTSFTEWWQCAVSFCEELDITNISNVKSFFSTLDVSLQRKTYLKQNQFARMQFFKPLQSTLCLASFTILYSTFLNLTAT